MNPTGSRMKKSNETIRFKSSHHHHHLINQDRAMKRMIQNPKLKSRQNFHSQVIGRQDMFVNSINHNEY
ncbi:hypothetical protein GBA52_025368 [Prunus armeniaca]|nr:hypothetical protein GBA52_025368 [Prunus armeniaca]